MKNWKKITFILFITFFSCRSNKTPNGPIEVLIEFPDSYIYDVGNQIYTVKMQGKPPLHIKFHLTSEELKGITDKYYELGLNKIPDRDSIIDKCHNMPRFITILKVTGISTNQVIYINSECSDFAWSISNKASRITSFIKFVIDHIRGKPEVKNAPMSDILYI